MSRKSESAEVEDTVVREPHRVRLPGFLIEEDVGLGDIVKRATSYIGVKPCGGCRRRADALNRWMTFTRRRLR
jgi:hypothetical protein